MIESWSRRAFSGSSGTYHVRATELAAQRERKLKALSATVVFLDETEQCFQLEKRSKGSALLDVVFQHLELVEKDYFGLQYAENDKSNNSNKPKIWRWLEPSKLVKKQIENGSKLYFRVKFYVSDPSKLQEEYTRYQFYLQIRRDIMQGKLQLPPSTACLLASYTVQSELGDYQIDEHGPNYLSGMQLVPGMNEDMERKISELHKLHKGQLPSDAEFNFLNHAKKLDMYGVDLHKAKDSSGRDLLLGVTAIGLLVFRNNIKINTYSWSKIMKISFKRRQFFIQLRRELSENYDTILGFNMESYRSSKTLWKACVEHHTFFRLQSPKLRRRFPLSFSSRFNYSGRTEYQTVCEGKQRSKLERVFVRSPSKHIGKLEITPTMEEKTKPSITPGRTPRPYDNKITVLGAKEPRKAWADEPQPSDDDGGFLERQDDVPFSPGRVIAYVDEEPSQTSPSNGIYETPPYSASHSPASPVLEEGLVQIKLQPDDQGRFGFNVKGGADLNLPIVISKVAPNTPADKCVPRLTEGDQVMLINGHDVSHAYHNDVVTLIKEARDSRSGVLILTIKPNVIYGSIETEEPPFQYVPVGGLPSDARPEDDLVRSMLLLADSLDSGALVEQYEQLYRKHPDLDCEESRKPDNINKNRYRDISPYDDTRVVLKNAPTGDYINANYVDMAISNSDIVNRYIATQGPLPSTSEDFWHMVREAQSTLIVMLTTVVERGKTKCHKYWPSINEKIELTNFNVTCTSEETDDSGSFVFRDFVMTDESGEERLISHMQYLAWPDHGVPESPGLFLRFTERVRELRHENPTSPVIVHCSAGIGRTGVLILMETAMCLIEANEPVYPLEIVKTMRSQRAMMIQNASQYRFVCESVYTAYSEGIVKPPDFQS